MTYKRNFRATAQKNVLTAPGGDFMVWQNIGARAVELKVRSKPSYATRRKIEKKKMGRKNRSSAWPKKGTRKGEGGKLNERTGPVSGSSRTFG